MKELSIEEKSKRYDDAIKAARALCKITTSLPMKEYMESIFPELKESEDEKIRQKLIKLVKMSSEVGGFALHKWKADEMLAWIEKQGKQVLPTANERAWLYLVSDVLTWKDGIGQYLDDPRVQELAKKLCSEYSQKLYNFQ